MHRLADTATATLAIVASNPAPEGARVATFDTDDGVRLRYAVFPKTGGPPRGTVCLVQGRTEFIEKYFETIADFQSRGFAVATFDWRGQGGSQRLIRNRKYGHVESFEKYWIDLKSFHGSILLPDCPAPYYLVGHSMGGLVALHSAARDRMMFDRVFLTAPMIGLDRQPLSPSGMSTVATALSFFGLGALPVGRAADKPMSEAAFAGNPVTSDLGRYMRSVEVLNARRDLEITLPTVRWAAAAFSAMAEAQQDAFPASIKVPVLILAAGNDQVVSTAVIEQFGLRMRTGRHVVVPAARHELLMETDIVRGQVLAAFDAFITSQSG